MNMSLRGYKMLLSSYLRPLWRRTSLLGILLLSGIALQLIGPQILRYFIDSAKAGSSLQVLGTAAVLYLVVALVTQFVKIAETYSAENIGWLATNKLRGDLALHCLELDMSFHNAHTPGEFIERIDGDVSRLANFFSRFIVYILGNVVLFLGIVVLLFGIHWMVGVAALVFAAVSALVLNALRDIAVPHWAAARQASAELFGFLEERLAGTEDIRSSGATGYVMRSSYGLARNLLRTEQKASLLGSLTGSSATLMLGLGTATSLAIGAYLFNKGAVTIGTVFLIFNYMQLLSQPIQQITRQIQDLQQATASISRIQTLMETGRDIEDGRGIRLPEGALSVDFDEVSFGYGNAEQVLRRIDVHLQPGKVLGLIGRTGSGKTTITRLLFRLYDPTEGRIRLGGVDLRDLSLDQLRGNVGIVTQDIQLFHAPVRENLTLFEETVPDDRILSVLEDIGMMDWYGSLSDGLNTKLAPGSTGLSAGEAQLLAFARVFLRDPGLVILDEASSRLDPATERKIERSVDRLLEGRTAIIIAHRLMTVQRADEILVLEDGEILEHGERAVLAADPGSRFHYMLQAGLEEALA